MPAGNNFPVSAALLSHPGRKRPNNEDYVSFFDPPDPSELRTSGRMYVLADGVGGAEMGERASEYATRKILAEYYSHPEIDPIERLRSAIQMAGNDIFNFVEESDHFTKMATTIVVAVVMENRLIIANVGDSRAYLIRNGQAQQITHDHSILGEQIRDGTLTEEQALHVKGSNKLTRSLGGEPDVYVDVDDSIRLQTGDRVLLCSDGLTRYALSQDIARKASNGDPEDVAERLIDYANDRGGADNTSVIVIEVGVSSSAQQPTILSRKRPDQVSLDTFQTEGYHPRFRRRRTTIFDGVFSGKNYWLKFGVISFIGGLVIIMVTAGILLVRNGYIPGIWPIMPVSTITQESSPTHIVPSVESTPTQLPGILEKLTPSPVPPTITDTSTIAPTATFTATLNPTPAPVFTPTPPVQKCVAPKRMITDQKYLYDLLRKFGIGYEEAYDKQYYYYDNCDEVNKTCSGHKVIENVDVIEQLNWIEISDPTGKKTITEDVCTTVGGYWVAISPEQ